MTELALVAAVDDIALVVAMDGVALVVAVTKMDPVASVAELALVVAVAEVVPDVLYDDRNMCKIVVTKYHLLQFVVMCGNMSNSPTCRSQLAPPPHFVLSATRIHMKAFDYQ